MISSEFQKAVRRLEEALSQPKDEYLRDSVIQRFEFSIELAWKTTRKIMGTATTAPKDVVREMGQAGYINQVEKWLEAIDYRNLSSHTYHEDLAEKTYFFAKDFAPLLRALAEKIKDK